MVDIYESYKRININNNIYLYVTNNYKQWYKNVILY